ncbi:MAG: glutamate 5-kinase [Acetivibrionales bacterium]
MSSKREYLRNAKRVVVKVGTSTLTYDNGKTNLSRIDKLSRVLSDLANQGREVILVSSGAIGVGVGKLKLKEKPESVRERQAVAAVGQCELMHIYSKFFSEYGHVVGQILLTQVILEDDHARNNVINTFETLLELGIVPIVNENDSVSVKEIMIGKDDVFSENDTLSAIVSVLVKADLLIILSDIDGFYDSDPRKCSTPKLIPFVEQVTPDIERCAGGAGTKTGRGGMVTKIAAAKIVNSAGVDMILANGKDPDIIMDIINGKEIGTLFAAKRQK